MFGPPFRWIFDHILGKRNYDTDEVEIMYIGFLKFGYIVNDRSSG